MDIGKAHLITMTTTQRTCHRNYAPSIHYPSAVSLFNSCLAMSAEPLTTL